MNEQLAKAARAWADWFKARLARIQDRASNEDYSGYEMDLLNALEGPEAAFKVLSIVEAAETRGVIPGRCKDCKHWSKNGSAWLALESDCGALVAASEAVDVPEDGSGFCWQFEAKP